MNMGIGIGIPEIVFVLVVILLPLWAARRFSLPRRGAARYVLLLTVAVLVAVFLFNWTATFRAVN